MSSEYETQAPGTISQLLRAVGGWSGVGGPGLFMFRSLILGMSTGAILGLAMAAVSVSVFSGPGTLAFIIGANAGFVGGTITYYRQSLRYAMLAIKVYPELMRLHLRSNYPLEDFEGESLHGLDATWKGGSMAVSAWESAGPAMTDLQSRKEVEILNGYAKGWEETVVKDGVLIEGIQSGTIDSGIGI